MKQKIPKEKIIADVILFSVAALVSVLATFIFDAHWSFYPSSEGWKFIFTGPMPYLVAFFGGGLAGFFILKLLFFAFFEEEIVWKRKRKKSN